MNSLYNAPDVDDTSMSSRASSRLLSLDSLSGLYDCDLDSRHEMAIVSASHKISSKFGPTTPSQVATGGSSGSGQPVAVSAEKVATASVGTETAGGSTTG